MKNLISNAYDIFLNLVNNDNYVNIISIIVVAITSYKVAQYNASKPEKLRVKQLQLSEVYLPLFRLFSDLPQNPSKHQALTLYRKCSNILNKNYELVFPQLHTLNKRLEKEILSNKNFNPTIQIMKHQVNTDYELLKRSLGYPSENFFSIFIRMSFRQKAELFVSWQVVFWLLEILIIPMLLFHLTQNITLVFVISLVAPVLHLYIILKLNEWLKKLKD